MEGPRLSTLALAGGGWNLVGSGQAGPWAPDTGPICCRRQSGGWLLGLPLGGRVGEGLQPAPQTLLQAFPCLLDTKESSPIGVKKELA